MHRGAWGATVLGVAKEFSTTQQLSTSTGKKVEGGDLVLEQPKRLLLHLWLLVF